MSPHYEPESEREDLIELRNLIGQAHATMALMWGSTDVRRAMASLQKAQTIIAARLDPPAPVNREEGEGREHSEPLMPPYGDCMGNRP